jgi:acetyltransferase-like isoleucine patch superfamily enzyme
MQHVQYASVPTVRGPLPDLVVEGRLTFGTGCRFRSFRTKTVLTVYPGAHLEIGDNVGMNDGVNICATKRIVIGAYTRIADMVFIYDTYFHDVSPDRTLEAKDVIIGRNVWIGARATILPGVRIGDHSVVGAGAVVTKDIPPKAIAVGSPATVVRTFECPDDWIRK